MECNEMHDCVRYAKDMLGLSRRQVLPHDLELRLLRINALSLSAKTERNCPSVGLVSPQVVAQIVDQWQREVK